MSMGIDVAGAVTIITAASSALGSAVLANYRRVLQRRSAGLQPPAQDLALDIVDPTPEHIEQLARDGSRFDKRCLSATRSIEALAAVAAAITVLSIQLLHRKDPGLTTTGFALAAGAFLVSLIASLLVLSTPIHIDERTENRASLVARAAQGDSSLGAFIQVSDSRQKAWAGYVLRLGVIVLISSLLIGAMACMAAGQFFVNAP